MEIGTRIKEFRKLRKMSLESLGEKVGVTAQSISLYERGLRTPNFFKIKEIAEALDIPTAFILDDERYRDYKDGVIIKFNKDSYEYNNDFESMINAINDEYPHFRVELNFLSTPAMQREFKYSYEELEAKGYAEMLALDIEKAIKESLKRIKEIEENKRMSSDLRSLMRELKDLEKQNSILKERIEKLDDENN